MWKRASPRPLVLHSLVTALGPGDDSEENDAWPFVLHELTILWGKQDLETGEMLRIIINCVMYPLLRRPERREGSL